MTVQPRPFVLLDDDPTGTQTVRDVPVLTAWDRESLRWAFGRRGAGFFVLTNTRSLTPDDARHRVGEIVKAARAAAAELGLDPVFASRGDSTLRGHFPLEVDAIADGLAAHTVRTILAPAYIEAGRITIDGVHYLRRASGDVRVDETDYATDATFGYASSDLREWVAQRPTGSFTAADVEHVDLAALRGDRVQLVERLAAGSWRVLVFDAVEAEDVALAAEVTCALEGEGLVLAYQIGPSFARARLGQPATPPLDDDVLGRIVASGSRGLVVVGSHVSLSTRQLDALVAAGQVDTVELDAAALTAASEKELVRTAADIAKRLQCATVVVSTSRELHRGSDATESLGVARAVSRALTTVVREIVRRVRPAYLVAKGGITSSDLVTGSLEATRAVARGALLPGIVSLWEPVDGCAPGIPYIVFAGNVGDDDSLAQVVDRLEQARAAIFTTEKAEVTS